MTEPQEVIGRFKGENIMPVVDGMGDGKEGDVMLLANGRVLENDSTWQVYFVEDGSEIVCLVRHDTGAGMVGLLKSGLDGEGSRFDSRLRKQKGQNNIGEQNETVLRFA